MREKLRAGVAGAGVFGGYHANKYLALEHVTLTAVFDVDPARAVALAARTGARAAASLDDLFADIDVLTVASPACTHFEVAEAALSAGLHVYVEKPLALEVDHATRLTQLADEAGRVLHVGHQERLVLSSVGLFDVDETPVNLEFSRCGPSSGRCEDVSVVWDLMVHDLDIAARMIGARPVDVAAAGDHDQAAATITFANGASASFFASRCSADRQRRMNATFDAGTVSVDFLTRTLESSWRGEGRRVEFGDLVPDPLGANVEAFVAAVRGSCSGIGVDGLEGTASVVLAQMVEQARGRVYAPARGAVRQAAQERLSA